MSLIEKATDNLYNHINDLARHHPYRARLRAIPVVMLDVAWNTLNYPLWTIQQLALAALNLLSPKSAIHLKASFTYAKATPNALFNAPMKFFHHLRKVWKDPEFVGSISASETKSTGFYTNPPDHIYVPKNNDGIEKKEDIELPFDPFNHILGFLEKEDVESVSLVCQSWNQATLHSAYKENILPIIGIARYAIQHLNDRYAKKVLSFIIDDTREFDVSEWKVSESGTVTFGRLRINNQPRNVQSIVRLHIKRIKLEEIVLQFLKDVDLGTLPNLERSVQQLKNPQVLKNLHYFLELAKKYRSLIKGRHARASALRQPGDLAPLSNAAYLLSEIPTFAALSASANIPIKLNEKTLEELARNLVRIDTADALVLAAKVAKRMENHAQHSGAAFPVDHLRSRIFADIVANLLKKRSVRLIALAADLVPNLPMLQPGNPYYRDPIYRKIVERLIAVGSPDALTQAVKTLVLIESPDYRETLHARIQKILNKS